MCSAAAEALKKQGNEYFARQKYGAAIDKYTEAIVMDNSISTYYSNRALCWYKKQNYQEMSADSSSAISLDKSNIKAHYLLGLSLVHLEDLERGIKSLTTAYDSLGSYCETKKRYFKGEIKVEILKAKKAQWFKNQELIKAKMDMLQTTLACICSSCDNTNGSNSYDEDTIASINEVLQSKVLDADEIASNEIPECYTCPISMEILLDPVTTPNGVSYEREMITKHLLRNKFVDPMTREELTLEMLRPNVALRDAIDFYLEQHPYAYE